MAGFLQVSKVLFELLQLGHLLFQIVLHVVEFSLFARRFVVLLVSGFAAFGLLLSALGIYAVISYSVNQRMHEFGLRMALGARPRDLMRLIVGQGLRLSLVGALSGLLFAAAFVRLLGSLLYGVSGTDPITQAKEMADRLLQATVHGMAPLAGGAPAVPFEQGSAAPVETRIRV